MNDDHAWRRDELAEQLTTAGCIRTRRVAAAFRAVPRHAFLPGVEAWKAHADEAIPTKWGADGRPLSSSSQPAIMAAMLEQLGTDVGQRVLEIGAGTGYNAALLAHLVGVTGAVTTIDIDEDLAEQARQHLTDAGFPGVTVVCGDGAHGCPERGPYDRITLTAGCWDVAPAWVAQLAPGGRLVLPLSLRGVQRSVAFEPADDHLASVSVIDCGFMPLRGSMAEPDRIRPLGDDAGIFLALEGDGEVDTAALWAALGRPGSEVATGVTVTAAECLGGLGLWMALHEPDIGRLCALGASAELSLIPPLITFPGMRLTPALIGESALAALVRTDQKPIAGEAFLVAARAFGAGVELAQRLVACVREWESRGRPSSAGLRIRAYPRSESGGQPTSIVLDRPHYRLFLDW